MGSNSDCNTSPSATNVDPEIDLLLKRPVEEIPDASKIQELPTLYLPGHHGKARKRKADSVSGESEENEEEDLTEEQHELLDSLGDAINYELLSKDRSKCTPAELDQIRRERNRMHAKRTRDRKRLFMEEMEAVINQLEHENSALETYWNQLNADEDDAMATSVPSCVSSTSEQEAVSQPHIILGDHLQSLLDAADFGANVALSASTEISASTTDSRPKRICDDEVGSL